MIWSVHFTGGADISQLLAPPSVPSLPFPLPEAITRIKSPSRSRPQSSPTGKSLNSVSYMGVGTYQNISLFVFDNRRQRLFQTDFFVFTRTIRPEKVPERIPWRLHIPPPGETWPLAKLKGVTHECPLQPVSVLKGSNSSVSRLLWAWHPWWRRMSSSCVSNSAKHWSDAPGWCFGVHELLSYSSIVGSRPLYSRLKEQNEINQRRSLASSSSAPGLLG